MARTRPTGSSGGSRRPSGGSHTHHHKPRHPRARHPRAHHPHAPKPDTRAPTPEPVTPTTAWPHRTPTPGTIPPLTPLAPNAIEAAPPLALTGAQRASLPDMLASWARQRDQSLSRLSRRPGGLAHLAGT